MLMAVGVPGKKKLSKDFCPLKIRNDLDFFLKKMNSGLAPGRFKFCENGGQIPTKGKYGQMTTTFAIKTAVQCGLWKNWKNDQKEGAIKFIESFQDKSGYFIDPWLKKSCKINLKDIIKQSFFIRSLKESKRIHNYNNKSNLRAETRQSSATLLMVDKYPKYPLPLEIYDEKSLDYFFKSLNWDDPWHANSQVSHQIMMLSINNRINPKKKYDDLIKKILIFFDSIYEKRTGTWVKNKETDKQFKLNGAMKFYSGLQWINWLKKKPNQALIDFALSIPIKFDGCNFTNSLFTLYHASKGLKSYKRDEIISRAIECLNHSSLHKINGSGYSFHYKSCQMGYYTQRTSRGGNQADMHGTGMFSLGITLALELMGEFAPKGSEYWKYHKT